MTAVRPHQTLLAWISVALLALVAAPAGGTPAAQRPVQKQADQRAFDLVDDAEVSYHAGRFDEAALLLAEAYRLDPDPIILYNMARALEGKGDLRAAVDAYRRYLHDATKLSDRSLIEGRIAAIEAQLAREEALRERAEEESRAAEAARQRATEQAAAAALARQREAEIEAEVRRSRELEEAGRERRARRRRTAAWLVAGLGAATLLAGVGAGVTGDRRYDASGRAADAASAYALEGDARRYGLGANLCFGIGATVMVAGAAWGLVETLKLERRTRRDEARP